MAGRPWEPWEVENIRRATWGEMATVARELGRSMGAVTSKRYRLGIGPPKRKWSSSEDAILDNVVAAGGHIQEAVARLGRSRRAAYSRRIARRAVGEEIPRATDGARVY